MTTLYAYANPRGGGGYDAGDPNEALSSSVSISVTAALAGTAAAVVGAGDRGVQDTETGASDDLVAQAATVSGSGLKVHLVTGSGALAPSRGALSAAGGSVPLRSGAGDLAATSGAIDALGEVAGQVAGVGVLQSAPSELLGVGGFSGDIIVMTSGSIVSQRGVLAGSGSVAALFVETLGAMTAGSARMYGVGGSGPIASGPPGRRRYSLRTPGGPRRPVAQ